MSSIDYKKKYLKYKAKYLDLKESQISGANKFKMQTATFAKGEFEKSLQSKKKDAFNNLIKKEVQGKPIKYDLFVFKQGKGVQCSIVFYNEGDQLSKKEFLIFYEPNSSNLILLHKNLMGKDDKYRIGLYDAKIINKEVFNDGINFYNNNIDTSGDGYFYNLHIESSFLDKTA